MDKPVIFHSGESLLEVKQSRNAYRLLLERDDMSIIANHVTAHFLIWLTSNRDQPCLEFYLLLSGKLSMRLGDTEELLRAGDSFYFDSLSDDVLLTPLEDTDFLCISSRPMFSEVTHLVDDMNTLNEQIERTGVEPLDLEGITSLPRMIEGVRVGITLRQQPTGSYIVSVRTEVGVDAAQICAHLGGGGHKQAAGCEILGSMDNAKAALLSEPYALPCCI